MKFVNCQTRGNLNFHATSSPLSAVTCHDTVAGPFDLILCCEVVYQLPQQAVSLIKGKPYSQLGKPWMDSWAT